MSGEATRYDDDRLITDPEVQHPEWYADGYYCACNTPVPWALVPQGESPAPHATPDADWLTAYVLAAYVLAAYVLAVFATTPGRRVGPVFSYA